MNILKLERVERGDGAGHTLQIFVDGRDLAEFARDLAAHLLGHPHPLYGEDRQLELLVRPSCGESGYWSLEAQVDVTEESHTLAGGAARQVSLSADQSLQGEKAGRTGDADECGQPVRSRHARHRRLPGRTSGSPPLLPARPGQGRNGAGKGEIPRLAGQTPGYLQAQLEAFGSGKRRHGTGQTSVPALALSEQEIEGLAQFLASRE